MAKETKKPPVNTRKPAPAKKTGRKADSTVRLPVLLELTFTSAALIVLVVGLVTALISFLTGAPVWVIALRSAGAVLVVGLAFYGISYVMSRGTLETNHAMREELRKQVEEQMKKQMEDMHNDPVPSTMERMA